MTVTSASNARAHLYGLIDQVNDDAEAVVITGRRGNAVLISEALYNSFIETDYLLSNPANAKRLRQAMADLRQGNYEPHDLIDPDAE